MFHSRSLITVAALATCATAQIHVPSEFGSLKAATLYRVRIEDGVQIEQEKLVTGLGR